MVTGDTMTAEEIMTQIDNKRAELSRLVREAWGSPRHIAATVEPRIDQLNAEISDLKAQLYQLGDEQTIARRT